MLGLSGEAKVFVYFDAMDMRKGFEGLSHVVETFYKERVTSGAYFAFLNRRKDRMKVLYWDGDGLVIWYKRLEKGRFAKNCNETLMNRREFLMLLEGITPKKLQQRYRLKPR